MAFHQGAGYVFDRDQFGGFLDMIVERDERVTTLEFDLFGLEEGDSETVQAWENNVSNCLCDLTPTNIDGDGVTTVEREWYISSYVWISFPKIYQIGYNTLLRSRKTGKTDRYDVQTGRKQG